MLSNKGKAYVAIIFAFVIIGTNPLLLRITAQSVTALEILTFRLTFAFLSALIPMILGKVTLNITLRDFRALLPTMLVYAVGFFTLQTLALEAIPATGYGIIFALSPVATAVLASIFAKEKTNGRQIAFIIISVSGVIFIMLMSGADPDAFGTRGTVLTIMTVLSFAATTILLRRSSATYTAHTITFMVAATGTVIFNIALIAVRLSEGTLGQFFSPLADWRILLAAAFLGCAGMFGTSFLQSYGLRQIESAKVVVFSNLSTAVTIFAGAVFLAESLYWYHILGAIAIAIGVVGTNRAGNRVRPAEANK